MITLRPAVQDAPRIRTGWRKGESVGHSLSGMIEALEALLRRRGRGVASTIHSFQGRETMKATMKRKKPSKPAQRSAKTGRSEHGFDFGVTRLAILFSGIEMNSDLLEANVQGCAYGPFRHPQLGEIPEISLTAEHGEPLKRALTALSEWDAAEGDDGFNLELLFLNDGGYLLGLAPNAAVIRNRLRGSDRFLQPIVSGPLFIKGMTTRNPFLSDFRAYIETTTITPFTFSGVQQTGPLTPPQGVAGMPQILKFSARFADEDTVARGTFAETMLCTRRGTLGKVLRRQRDADLWQPDRNEPARIPRQREDQIRRHFPVTFWRLSGSSTVDRFRLRNAMLRISEAQAIQGLINLALSNEIVGTCHYVGVSRKDLPSVVQSALRERFESADSKDLPVFDDDLLLKQIFLDGKAMLEALDLKPKKATTQSVLNVIAREGLA